MVALKEPDAAPAAVGLKFTDAVPLPPLAATVSLVGETVKAPLADRVTVAEPVPVFVTVTVFDGLVWLMLTLPKSSDAGLTAITTVGAADLHLPALPAL